MDSLPLFHRIAGQPVIVLGEGEAAEAKRRLVERAGGLPVGEDDLAARPSHHDGADDHEHDDFDTVVIDLPEISDVDALVAAIQRLATEQHVLRVKGYVAVTGKPMRLLVQAVGTRVRHQFDRPWGATPRQGQLVVIAEHHDIDLAAIRAVLGA